MSKVLPDDTFVFIAADGSGDDRTYYAMSAGELYFTTKLNDSTLRNNWSDLFTIDNIDTSPAWAASHGVQKPYLVFSSKGGIGFKGDCFNNRRNLFNTGKTIKELLKTKAYKHIVVSVGSDKPSAYRVDEGWKAGHQVESSAGSGNILRTAFGKAFRREPQEQGSNG